MAGIAGIGLISSFLMKGLPLHTEMDKRWGLEAKEQGVDAETAAPLNEIHMDDVTSSVVEGKA